MNVGKISNVAFNGAYIITGRGEDVKNVEDEIKQHKECRIVGSEFGYSAADMPAYLLITTGKDTDKYDKFIALDEQKETSSFKKTSEKMPEKFTRDDFKDVYKYMKYKALHQYRVWLTTIKQECGFDNLQLLDSKKALESINEGNFNYSDGTFLNKAV